MKIEIDLSQLKGLEDTARRYPERILKTIDEAAGRAAGELTRAAKREAPQADGQLVNSIQPSRITLGEWIVGTGQQYAPHVEHGTKGGGSPPVVTLLEWIKRKRIAPKDPRMTLESLAHVMQRSIYARGTAANPFMRRTVESNTDRVKQIFSNRLEKAIESLRNG